MKYVKDFFFVLAITFILLGFVSYNETHLNQMEISADEDVSGPSSIKLHN